MTTLKLPWLCKINEPFVDYNLKLETTEMSTTHHYPRLPAPNGSSFSIFQGIWEQRYDNTFRPPSVKLSTREALQCVLEQDSSVIRGGRACEVTLCHPATWASDVTLRLMINYRSDNSLSISRYFLNFFLLWQATKLIMPSHGISHYSQQTSICWLLLIFFNTSFKNQ